MVYGGESVATGAILDDLWVLDLSNRDTLAEPLGALPWLEETNDLARLCPWHRIEAVGGTIGPDGGGMDGDDEVDVAAPIQVVDRVQIHTEVVVLPLAPGGIGAGRAPPLVATTSN